jgi:hypothetical protein
VPFFEWCGRISHFIQGGDSFKPEKFLDVYALLPAFWHGMTPDEKKLADSIFKSHENTFSVACVKQLHTQVHVPLSDMQNLRVCLEEAAVDPSHLERTVLTIVEKAIPAELAAAKATKADVSQGLASFQLHPKAKDGTQLLSGMAKFEHMIKIARRSVDARPSPPHATGHPTTQQQSGTVSL